MRPIEGFGIPGFFHPIDRRKSEQFVSFLYTTYRGIRKSGLFSDQFGPEIRVFWQVTLRNPGFLGKLLSEIRLFSDLKNYPSIGGVHILSGIAHCMSRKSINRRAVSLVLRFGNKILNKPLQILVITCTTMMKFFYITCVVLCAFVSFGKIFYHVY